MDVEAEKDETTSALEEVKIVEELQLHYEVSERTDIVEDENRNDDEYSISEEIGVEDLVEEVLDTVLTKHRGS